MDLVLFIKLMIATIFLSTFLSKIKNFQSFVNTVGQFAPIRDKRILSTVSLVVVVSEVVFPIMLFIPKYSLVSSIAIISMLNIFSILIVKKLKNKMVIKCNCGGLLGNHVISKEIPIRNSVLSLGLVYLLFAYPTSISVSLQQVVLMEITSISILFSYFFVKEANMVLRSIE
ncbi:MauE/DoxX family redox-associated membrane protein [Paenibacillus enshidis]|uniref:MauE/DoxX family redox-associated membrane protein n=1 Tax=Paenibacillus enshidis TaxID=1458439 RepID=A0ABV5AY88_9BACL